MKSCECCGQPIKAEGRSQKQNRLYWKWLREISQETGYKDWELHESFKEVFLPAILEQQVNSITGKPRELSSTDCNVKQMTEYLNEIEQYAADPMGIVLPRPEDLYQAAMGRHKSASSNKRG